MKKIIIATLLAFLLVGCGEKTTKISNGNETIWEYKDTKFTSQELYETMKAQNITGLVISYALDEIAKIESIDTEEYKLQAENEVKEIIEQVGSDYLDLYYGGEDQYVKQVISNNILTDLCIKLNEENYEKLKEEKIPYKAEIVYFDDIENAKKVIDDVSNEVSTFAYSCSVNGYTGNVSPTIYTDTADLPVEVKEMILKTDKKGLTDIIQSSTYATDNSGNSVITPRYYIVNLISKNVDEFKDEFIEYVSQNETEINDVINHYLKKYKLEIHEQSIYEQMLENYGDYK